MQAAATAKTLDDLDSARAIDPGTAQTVPPWSSAKRIAFRWLFVYVGFYMLQPSPLDFVAPGLVAPYSELWERIVKGAGRLLGLHITVLPNASGDTTYNYVQVLCYAALAAVAALVWTAADRRRADYRRLYDWLRAAVRVYLAIFMFLYGSAKVIKTQFPDLSPLTLHQPLGDFTPNMLLWTFMGASTLYTFWSGLLEMVGGALLVSRRTTLLGSLVCVAVMSNVLMLNLSYDVVVKLFALHLLALAVFLAAADARRLLDFFVRNRPVGAAELRPLFAAPRRHRLVLVARTASLVLIALLLLAAAGARRHALTARSGKRLEGSWVVEQLTVGGVTQGRAIDAASWRRLVIDSRQRAAVQLGGGEWRRYSWQLAGRTLELDDDGDAVPAASLEMKPAGAGRLELAGTVGGRPMHALLAREEPRFRLLDRDIHWIREGPVR